MTAESTPDCAVVVRGRTCLSCDNFATLLLLVGKEFCHTALCNLDLIDKIYCVLDYKEDVHFDFATVCPEFKERGPR